MTWRSLCPGKYFEIQAWKWRLCFSCHCGLFSRHQIGAPAYSVTIKIRTSALRISFRIRIWQDCLVSEMRQCRVREGNYLTAWQTKRVVITAIVIDVDTTFRDNKNQDWIMTRWSSFELEQWAYTQQISEESFELRISDITMNKFWELCFWSGGELSLFCLFLYITEPRIIATINKTFRLRNWSLN